MLQLPLQSAGLLAAEGFMCSLWVEMGQGEESREYFRTIIDERAQDP